LVAHFEGRRISMAFIGKSELMTVDGKFFFKTIVDRKIALAIIVYFGIPKISFDTIGSYLDDMIIKERYFSGETRTDIEKGKISHGKAQSLFLEYENEVFEQFNSGKDWTHLESAGMPHKQAFEIWHNYLDLPESIYKS
jgi:hypothetical protein